MAMRWYIVHAYSNFEKKVAEAIEEKAKQKGLDHFFDRILVPTEKVVEVRRGRKVDSERKFFPGYVLVRADLNDEVFHLIKNTPRVTGFLGSDQKPVPIPDSEAEHILAELGLRQLAHVSGEHPALRPLADDLADFDAARGKHEAELDFERAFHRRPKLTEPRVKRIRLLGRYRRQAHLLTLAKLTRFWPSKCRTLARHVHHSRALVACHVTGRGQHLQSNVATPLTRQRGGVRHRLLR